MHSLPILSLSIWTPICFGALLLLAGRTSQPSAARWVAVVGALISFLLTIPLISQFDRTTAAIQFSEKALWISRFNVHYHLGIDGLSMWFIPLTAFMTLIVIVAAWNSVSEQVHQYLGAFLILSGLMIGVFTALDGVLFYVFFEATLIPMYIIIGIWGGPQRVYAAFKFFLYTLAGSLLLLVALIYLYTQSSGSFDILTWHKLPLAASAQTLIFFCFLAAFAVKVPMFPVHTWLPDVHVEAPTGGSAILAAIMLKLGAYGFLRFSLPITPDASREWAWLLIASSLVAVIYIGLVALVQQDMKKLVAYSSIAHMGFVTLGFFMFDSAGNGSELGVSGAIVQMISHGFVSGAMFLVIGVLYDRMHSRQIADYGGVVNTMPKFAALALLFAMANAGLPATSGFVGEFMVILAAVKHSFWIGVLAATTLVFGAAYTLWMYKRVFFGQVEKPPVRALADVDTREFLILFVLALAVLYMGIHPKPFTDVMSVSVNELVRHVALSKVLP